MKFSKSIPMIIALIICTSLFVPSIAFSKPVKTYNLSANLVITYIDISGEYTFHAIITAMLVQRMSGYYVVKSPYAKIYTDLPEEYFGLAEIYIDPYKKQEVPEFTYTTLHADFYGEYLLQHDFGVLNTNVPLERLKIGKESPMHLSTMASKSGEYNNWPTDFDFLVYSDGKVKRTGEDTWKVTFNQAWVEQYLFMRSPLYDPNIPHWQDFVALSPMQTIQGTGYITLQ